MAPKINMIGRKFNRLTVINQYSVKHETGQVRTMCECFCECGNPNIVICSADNLRRDHTKSCGCHKLELLSINKKKYNQYDLSGEYGICYSSNKNSEIYFDKEDFNLIYPYCWQENSSGYAATADNDAYYTFMHNMVMNNLDLVNLIDHKNRDRKDNRKENLRFCTTSQNAVNKKVSIKNTSGVTGVCFQKKYNKWKANLTFEGKFYLSDAYFDTFEEAVYARLIGEKFYFGEFAPQQHLFEQYGISLD